MVTSTAKADDELEGASWRGGSAATAVSRRKHECGAKLTPACLLPDPPSSTSQRSRTSSPRTSENTTSGCVQLPDTARQYSTAEPELYLCRNAIR